MDQALKEHFDGLVEKYNKPSFIPLDPISVPKRFTKKQDVEISGFWTAVLSWGQRKTIINKANSLFELMDNNPYSFILNHKEKDLRPFLEFKHRTFNAEDTLYFIRALKRIYHQYESLEELFLNFKRTDELQVEEMLNGFQQYFFDDLLAPQRTRKHVSAPIKKSTCKRLNMFMRWMVRRDENGVDFGIWGNIPMSSLKIPLDVHVERIARRYNLIQRKQRDWKTVLELSECLSALDPKDPVKYDYALFGEGVMEQKVDMEVL